MTSRIKQAIGSVQLFVQRCFLAKEPHVHLDEEAAARWKWMKSYRVWEANRKVFLYPENWIELDVRDDKTPLFEAFEGELLQGDLTRDAAEDAMLHYLKDLDQVARLEIVATYHEQEDADDAVRGGRATDVLHVFARTGGKPRVYFYRRRVDGSRWTPWERTELENRGRPPDPGDLESKAVPVLARLRAEALGGPSRAAWGTRPRAGPRR